MPDQLPEIAAPSAPPLDSAQLDALTTPSTTTAPPIAPAIDKAPIAKKKLSGGARRGDMTSADYKKKKADVVKERDALRAQLGIQTTTAPTGGPVQSGVVRSGPDPVTAREQMAEKLGALASCVILLVFEMLANWRGKTWEITETRADSLGELWGDYFSYVMPDTMTPKDLALLTAAGGTGALVLAKVKQEREAKAQRATAPAGPSLDREPPRPPAAAVVDRPLFAKSRGP